MWSHIFDPPKLQCASISVIGFPKMQGNTVFHILFKCYECIQSMFPLCIEDWGKKMPLSHATFNYSTPVTSTTDIETFSIRESINSFKWANYIMHKFATTICRPPIDVSCGKYLPNIWHLEVSASNFYIQYLLHFLVLSIKPRNEAPLGYIFTRTFPKFRF